MIILDKGLLWLSIAVDILFLAVAIFNNSEMTFQVFSIAIIVKAGIALSMKDVKDLFKNVDIEVRATNIKVEKTGENKKEIDKL